MKKLCAALLLLVAATAFASKTKRHPAQEAAEKSKGDWNVKVIKTVDSASEVAAGLSDLLSMEKQGKVHVGGSVVDLLAYVAAGYRVDRIDYVRISNKSTPDKETCQAQLVFNERVVNEGRKDFVFYNYPDGTCF